MRTEPEPYVQPEIADARVERLWVNLAEQLEARAPRRAARWGLAVGLALSASAAAFWVLRGADAPSQAVASSQGVASRSLAADARLQTRAESLSVRLSDGSSLALAAESDVEVRGSKSSQVRLALDRGSVTCDVTHREGRAFSVVAGDVAVRVVGTQFTVKRGAGELPRVEVSVLRGVVEVESRRRPGVVARVAAGQSWIQDAETGPEAAASAVSAEPATPTGTPRASSVVAPVTPPPGAESASGATARELFEKAGEHRRAGAAAAAARGYEELLRRYPGDPRASLAAFELGRLRMDRLGDGAGAVAALERALASSLGPSFREDALARLVSAYAAQGNSSACARARDRYLARYPAGVHAAAVATRCGAR